VRSEKITEEGISVAGNLPLTVKDRTAFGVMETARFISRLIPRAGQTGALITEDFLFPGYLGYSRVNNPASCMQEGGTHSSIAGERPGEIREFLTPTLRPIAGESLLGPGRKRDIDPETNEKFIGRGEPYSFHLRLTRALVAAFSSGPQAGS
jgi:hypothetical protein